MTRTVLVTGVGGFVGSHVVESLLDATDWHVIGVDSFRHNGHFVNFVDATGVGHRVPSRVTALVHDLTTPFSPRQCARLRDVDYVVNVASRSSVDESIAEPVAFVRNNVDLALNVLELCRVVRPRRLVHVSTDEVYGPGQHTSVVDHRPSSPYAASKAAQVDLVWAYARTFDVPATVVTSANMFGERQSYLAFIPRVVRAVQRGEYVDVHYHNGRPGERSYTYVRNVTSRVVDELRRANDDNSTLDQVDHVVLPGQRRVANDELARDVAKLVGQPLLYRVVEATQSRPGYDPTYVDLDATWEPAIDFATGLERFVSWALDDNEVAGDVRRST